MPRVEIARKWRGTFQVGFDKHELDPITFKRPERGNIIVHDFLDVAHEKVNGTYIRIDKFNEFRDSRLTGTIRIDGEKRHFILEVYPMRYVPKRDAFISDYDFTRIYKSASTELKKEAKKQGGIKNVDPDALFEILYDAADSWIAQLRVEILVRIGEDHLEDKAWKDAENFGEAINLATCELIAYLQGYLCKELNEKEYDGKLGPRVYHNDKTEWPVV